MIRLLDANGDLIARRAGRRIEIVAVSARDRTKDRGADISRFDWIDDPAELARHAQADVIVELVGGADGPALALARAALGAGKSLVTANKAMIAHHGLELAQAAEAAGAALKFEAAVAGARAGDQGAARRRRGERDRPRLRHPQRHLQFHPLQDGSPKRTRGGPGLRRYPRRGATAGLCRGRSELRHRRRRRRAQAVDPREPGVRHAARVRRCRSRRHPPCPRRRRRRGGGAGAIACGCWAWPMRGPTGCSSASTRISCRSATRSRTSPDRPTQWSPRAISSAGCCSRARARATGPPPARWSPT